MASCNECIHNELCDIHGHMNANECRLYRDKCEPYREFADRIYKFFCNKQNWNVFKDQWLENGECSWLKENINNLVKELTEKNDKE